MSRVDMNLKPGHSVPANRIIKARLRNLDDSAQPTNMAVDGSGTPVTFSYVFSVEAVIGHLVFYMSDGKNFDEDTFAGITRLSNGLQIKVAGVEVFNWRDNLDVIAAITRPGFPGSVFGKASRVLNGMVDFEVWGGEQKGIYVRPWHNVSAVVRDDLSALDFVEMTVHAVEID